MSAHLTRVVVRRITAGEILVEPLDLGCGRCHEPGGCGGVKMTCSGPRLFRAQDTLGVVEGELVEVAIATGRLGRLVTYTYLFPLVGLLFGALLTSGFPAPYELAAAIVGLLLGYVLGRRAIRRAGPVLPVVVKRCGMYLENEK